MRFPLTAPLALLFLVTSALADGAPTRPSTTTQRTTQDAAQPGLVMSVYALPVRPKRLRDVLPGLPPTVVRVVPAPTIATADDLGGLNGNVQAEYEGEIDVPAAGEYAFTAKSDDGMDLSVDGRFVLADQWAGRTRPAEATLTLAAGWQPVRVRFYQSDGGFNLAVRWRPPGAADFAPIPPDRFRAPAATLAAEQAKQSAAPDADPAHAHRTIFRSHGFFELPERDGDLLVTLLEGPTTLSAAARKDFAELRRQSHLDELPYWHQTQVLAGFLRGWYAGQTTRGPVTTRASYAIADAVAVDYDGWNGAKRHGFRHVATIEGREFTIYTPAADSVERESVAAGIAGLPATLRGMLHAVRVEPYGTANEFNGGGGEIWVRRGEPTPREMIDNVIAHEIGHLLMDRTGCRNAWATALDADTLSTSQYGRSNASEDFAEFTRLYLSTQGDAAQLASLGALFPARMPVMRDALAKVNFAWPTTAPTTGPTTSGTRP